MVEMNAGIGNLVSLGMPKRNTEWTLAVETETALLFEDDFFNALP
jgi:hypothetical protein